jgi:hypothetical protein
MPSARLRFEMGGGNKGEDPGPWRETYAPDWVRLLLTGGSTKEVRVIYGDDSYIAWRLRIY